MNPIEKRGFLTDLSRKLKKGISANKRKGLCIGKKWRKKGGDGMVASHEGWLGPSIGRVETSHKSGSTLDRSLKVAQSLNQGR